MTSPSFEIKINVLNKDIGFIKHGQEVAIKLEAFPFTEYGTLRVEVKTISANAIPNDNGDLLYTCIIKIVANNIFSFGKQVELRTGMRATAEIVLR